MGVGSTTHEIRADQSTLSCGVGHWACGAVSGVLTLVVVALVYSTLVAVVSVVPLLSTTAIVLGAIVLWLLLWLAVDASRRRFFAAPT